MNLAPSILTWLRCFEATARNESFTRAAEELNLSQGAVSQQVRQLEQWSGCVLFHRLPRSLTLTSQGSYLQAEVEPALRRIEDAVSTIRTKTGPVQVNCSPSFALLWLMPRLGDFIRRHPNIDVQLTAQYHGVDRTVFTSGDVHVAIRYDPFSYDDLVSETLIDEYLIPVGNADTATSCRELARVGDFEKIAPLHDSAPWIGAPDHAEWHNWLQVAGFSSVTLCKGLYFNLAALAVAAAIAGEGVVMARTALVMSHLQKQELVPLSKKVVRASANYKILTLDVPDTRVAAFTGWLREQCAKFKLDRASTLTKIGLADPS